MAGYIPPSRRAPCSKCGKTVAASRTSAAAPTCRPCQRTAYGLRPDESVIAARASGRLRVPRNPCIRCGAVVEPPIGSRRWKFCSDECFRKHRNARGSGGVKKGRAERGYDYAHQLLRAELLPLAYGTPCHLCGDLMEEGQDLHLDHTEDRRSYRGMTHGVCNVLDGAKRGGERARQIRLEKGWRHGSSTGPRRRSQDSAA